MNGPYFNLSKAGETKRGTIQFVHWPCGKPSEPSWRAWLAQCDTCLGLFSGPWSTLCKACWREDRPEDPYPGWSHARKLEQFGRLNQDSGNK